MAVSSKHGKVILDRILQGRTFEELAARLKPKGPDEAPLPPHMSATEDASEKAVRARRSLLAKQGFSTDRLSGRDAEVPADVLRGNIENLVGYARIPVGVIGPLRVNGPNAHGDFYVPMATTEGALVASYNRGAMVLSQAGGVSVACLHESVSRAPCFVFENLAEAGHFLSWVLPQVETFQEIVDGTSRHCRFIDLKSSIAGREVHLILEFTTGDAAGQNMVTLAADAIGRRLAEESPVRPRRWYVEGNMSGDKKATMLAFTYARGKQVVADATLPAALVGKFLHTTPVDMARYWQSSMVGGVQSGSIGVQGHFANAIAALFLACGQDVACVSEASVGITRMDVTEDGSLYASVGLPNLIVGTVGGGTSLPTASECLAMMGCAGEGKARKFAEICASVVLAGEVSIIAALAAGHFAQAHARLGRKPAGR